MDRRYFNMCLSIFYFRYKKSLTVCIRENPCPTRPNGIAGRANCRQATSFPPKDLSDKLAETGRTDSLLNGNLYITQQKLILP